MSLVFSPFAFFSPFPLVFLGWGDEMGRWAYQASLYNRSSSFSPLFLPQRIDDRHWEKLYIWIVTLCVVYGSMKSLLPTVIPVTALS